MATALAGAGSALSGIFSALGSQGRRDTSVNRPQIESALPVLSATQKKNYRKLQKEADKERLYYLITQPEVLGLLITLGGMLAANHIPFSGNEAQNKLLQSTAVTASVLLGLGYAGVGDLTTLIIALTAGGGSLLSGASDLLNLPTGLGDTNIGPGSTGGWYLPLWPGVGINF